jgi:hypothetical protein
VGDLRDPSHTAKLHNVPLEVMKLPIEYLIANLPKLMVKPSAQF